MPRAVAASVHRTRAGGFDTTLVASTGRAGTCLIAYEHRRGAPFTLIFRDSPLSTCCVDPSAFVVSPRTLRALKRRLCITGLTP